MVRLKLVFLSTTLSASSGVKEGEVLVHFLGGEGGVVGLRRDDRSGVRADGGVNPWTGGGRGGGTLRAGRASGGDCPATGRDNGTAADTGRAAGASVLA